MTTKPKLGCRRSPLRDVLRNVHLSSLLAPQALLPPLRATCDWTQAVTDKTPWLMLGNGPDDTVKPGFQGCGDCVLVAAHHMSMLWNFNAGNSYIPKAGDVVEEYRDLTGYDPSKDPPPESGYENPTDTGLDPSTFLKYWRGSGIGLLGAKHEIGAWLALNPKRFAEYQYAIQELEGAYLSFSLPLGQDYNANTWDIPAGADLTSDLWYPGGLGGHMVMSARSRAGNVLQIPGIKAGIWVITWGGPVFVTFDFLSTYCVEAFGLVSNEMLTGEQGGPTGLDMPGLLAALAAVAQI